MENFTEKLWIRTRSMEQVWNLKLHEALARVRADAKAATYSDYSISDVSYEQEYGNELHYMAALEKQGLCRMIYPHRSLFEDGMAHMMNDKYIVYHDHNHLMVSVRFQRCRR